MRTNKQTNAAEKERLEKEEVPAQVSNVTKSIVYGI